MAEPRNPALTPEQGDELLQLARRTVDARVRSEELPRPGREPWQEVKQGVFVTLTKGGRLRGCIGFPLPIKPLGEAIVDAAVSAATSDPRFNAVTPDELEDIELEISVLTPPRVIDDIEEIVVGRSGLILTHLGRRGLLLPQVASEHDWDRETFLTQTCYKAGLDGDAWREGAQIEIFEAQIFGPRGE